MCMPMCPFVGTCTVCWCLYRPKDSIIAPGSYSGLEVAVSHYMGVLGTELNSSTKGTTILNCCFPRPDHSLKRFHVIVHKYRILFGNTKNEELVQVIT